MMGVPIIRIIIKPIIRIIRPLQINFLFPVLRTVSCTGGQVNNYIITINGTMTSHSVALTGSACLVRIVSQSRDLSQYFKIPLLTSSIPTCHNNRREQLGSATCRQ